MTVSHVHPRLRAKREALPDPTGLGEAIGRRRDARRETLRRVDLEFFALAGSPERPREFAKRSALAREETRAEEFEIALERDPHLRSWLIRQLSGTLDRLAAGTQRVTTT